MRILDLALKDISQILRDKRSLLFLLVMPVLFTFFFGFMFSSPQGESDNRLPVGLLNEDEDGLLAQPLEALLAASATVRPVLLDAEAAQTLDQQVAEGQLAAALVIPPGFSAATLRGESPQLEVLLDEQSQNGQTARRALQTTLHRLLGMAQSARQSLSAYEQSAGALDEAARATYLQDALERGLRAWLSPALTVKVSGPVAEEDPMFGSNPYNQFSPGMIVQFAIFGLVQAATVLVLERRCGALARMLTTPVRKVEIIAGHLLGIFILVFSQQALLVGFAQVFLKVNYLRDPLAVFVMMTALSLLVASLGLLIAALAGKEDQVILMAMAAMFIISALGGAWFSLEVAGETFSTIGHFTPGAWAMDGFQNIILRGLGSEAVLLPAGILLAYSLVFFGLAVWRFKFE